MTRAPVRRGAARRTELLDALVELLLAEGFAAFTLDDLSARLHCSKRTLYAIAGSKEQLVRAAVVHFFRNATVEVEDAIADEPDPAARIARYLSAVAAALRPASAAFIDDVAAFPPAAEIYERNTQAAAERIRTFVDEGVAAGAFRDVHTGFVADVVASTMVRIQQRQVAATTGLSDADAYTELAALVTTGLVPAPSQ
ncbi:TetR/AcrR family transcriptional regulator [Cryptosporangium aurantiacum]|uniref:Transcriptional regulator, TetR family n=1 Tax=Cryptosporangium aurantiacum TaxID=134849 RepID=A0A1M7RIW1_9ACTN|nr:TetR/AcrR family transcriptional regulator [Cryptosporangium aurantiacum]SHN46227.1 transcriptional regulator, TetR family [Cryptosporangium aurantiacum]